MSKIRYLKCLNFSIDVFRIIGAGFDLIVAKQHCCTIEKNSSRHIWPCTRDQSTHSKKKKKNASRQRGGKRQWAKEDTRLWQFVRGRAYNLEHLISKLSPEIVRIFILIRVTVTAARAPLFILFQHGIPRCCIYARVNVRSLRRYVRACVRTRGRNRTENRTEVCAVRRQTL